MKILTTLFDMANIEKLSVYADGFLIGNNQFGTRLTRSYDKEEIIKIMEKLQSLKKEIFLMCNQMFTDEQLVKFSLFLQSLPLDLVHGIIVSDIGAIMTLKSLGYEKLAVYHPETLLTNSYDFNDLHKEHILGAVVAKEIVLEDIITIGLQKKHQLFMMGHGHLNMFYTKRKLVENYIKFSELDIHLTMNQKLKLTEETRHDEQYPILEDEAGTHVFRSKVFASIAYIDQFRNVVDYFIIDTIFKDDLYALYTLKMYQNGLIDEDIKHTLEKDYQESWDLGFFFKKTIYKQSRE